MARIATTPYSCLGNSDPYVYETVVKTPVMLYNVAGLGYVFLVCF